MKTVKQKLVVEVEVLDTQVAPRLVHAALHQLMQGVTTGTLEVECGDTVKWTVSDEKVEF